MSANSLSVYETWVRTLRAWRRDPLIDLSQLPTLDETSFPPATYQRLINHLNEAITEQMKRWQSQTASTLGAATDDHARARALVDAREGLAHRLKLARHTAFPEQIRSALITQAENDIRSLQTQLERDAQHVAAAASASNRPVREATLKLFRDNPLTAVLDPNFSLDGTIDDTEMRRAESVTEEDLAATSGQVQEFVARRPRRIVSLEEE